MTMNTQLNRLTKKIVKFRDERNWRQFHNSKDLALAISIEASELNELFLWKNAKEVRNEFIADELADVFMYAFLLAYENGIDVEKAIHKKLQTNMLKYPIAQSKGNAKKYTEL
jgi:NTP pyrophosphatase (non-canonical NTP hydrolase)